MKVAQHDEIKISSLINQNGNSFAATSCTSINGTTHYLIIEIVFVSFIPKQKILFIK
jgi:hypothetical protein